MNRQGLPIFVTNTPRAGESAEDTAARSAPRGKPKALQTQVGGTHYSDMAIQPAAYNLANNMGWAEGDAISYISRWRKKGGLQDLRKARQTLLLLIEHEEAKGTE